MRDLILDAKAQEAPQRFIASIDQSEILKLASSYHDNEPCQVFQPVKHGSFNVCFFVQFATPSSDGVPDRWVVRLPIREEVPWIDEKMDVEIATMKYVAANTTIPVPRIRAHSSAKNSPIKMAFIIMDYIKGKNLRELGFPKDLDVWYSGTTQPTKAREKMYQNLAQLYIQLRQLEFPEIGALGLPKRTMTRASGFPEHKAFKTSKEYVDALLWLGDNLLDKGTNSMLDIRGERGLYASHDFRRFVMESWLDAAQDCGPFVLVHGDLGIQNLLWDDDLNLVAVLDWEWSSVMPLQFFVPPPWLDGNSIDFLCHGQILYNCEVSKLCEIVRDQEKSLGFGCSTLLSDEWDRRKDWCHTLVVCALLRPEYVFDAYWSFISYTLVGFLPYTPQQTKKYVEITSRQIALFMENDDRKAFLSRKQEEQKVYLKEEEDYFGPLDDCQDIGN
ncbi:hypothetical protein H634G_01846 [Metarhizium anisopliae BRIP 53293]|uniref:Aminoglycoside phosphotransferase domain-containing protein n=1 Tax=Metarhizium anisopliae BRIP 53293 TaxID=1291518 RepID=A0A0D9P911_METAN|nr:hypothetical protein H634G_01846 [Metarhizium anisopliae BRIP 53293]KJK94193.1 hypothetical protein H633G_01888 [Metarhizium anisopliae BRIP 53284]